MFLRWFAFAQLAEVSLRKFIVRSHNNGHGGYLCTIKLRLCATLVVGPVIVVHELIFQMFYKAQVRQ
jgi:hypothetical protein